MQRSRRIGMPGPGCIYGGLIFFVFFRLSHSDQFADRISHRGKLFFIFCHDISHHHILLVMQIKGMCQKSPSFRFCHFLEGKFKQIFIVRFKFYRFTSCQNLTVTSQKFSGSQSSFCMTCLGPRIRKIQINTLYLSFFKNIRKNFRQLFA